VLVLEERHGVETVEGCRGLGWRAPGLGAMMAVFLFSLTGLPPTAGFAGKLLVFSALIRRGLEGDRSRPATVLAIPLVGVAVLFTVVSLFYYARIVAALFLSRPREEEPATAPAPGPVSAAVLGLLAAATLALGLFWGPLQALADGVTRSILARP
jgi:NADH-quinone oxidoreductase subunit N